MRKLFTHFSLVGECIGTNLTKVIHIIGGRQVELYGNKVCRKELMKYIGDISMIADAREGVLTAGKADGVRVIDVKTGSGLEFSVLPTRGMDIAWAQFKGMPLAHLSKTGVVHPAYFEKDGLSFLRNFFCGLLTTCGLTYFGAPCKDQGEELGLHGRISNIPAYDVSVKKEWAGDEYLIRIRGKVSESCVFNENLILTREIETKLGSSKLRITDRVENTGFNQQPLMLLYHCNFGYPIVSEDTVILEPEGTKIRARDAEGITGECRNFQMPTHDYKEQVFYHDIPPVSGTNTYCALFNRKLSLGVYVKFSKEELPVLGEWKMMGEGDYVVGLEPATWYPEGRNKAREAGELMFIQPGEVKEFTLEIGVLESEDELKGICSF